jgi:hypothetical protein
MTVHGRGSKMHELVLPPPVMFSANISLITPTMAENSELRSSVVLAFLFLYYSFVCLNAVSKLLLN